MIRTVQITILLALLAACGRPYIQDNSPPLQEKVAAGDSLVLHKTLTFLPKAMYVRLQFSEILGQSQIIYDMDKYEPDCILKLKSHHYKRIEIEPQAFRITKVESYAEDAGLVDLNYYGIRLYLDSRQQPELEMLDCRYPGEVYEPVPFSTQKFEMTVGDIMSIKRQ